jgi:PleD family two-component response regulator
MDTLHTPSSDPAPQAAPIKVLLVDDQRLTGLVLQRLLASEPDIEVRFCQESAAAAGMAREFLPSVILQDLVMPDADGLSMLSAYRADPLTAAIPVVVLSGNDDVDTRARSLAAGAADYLVKMPAKHDLVACIRRHAGAGAPEASLTTSPAS